MSRAVYFIQECPTCGRRVQVRLEYLGRHLVCEHCHGGFVATDHENGDAGGSGERLLERADELLASADALRRRMQ